MKTQMKQTSLDAYRSIKDLNKKQKRVYEAIKVLQPCTDNRIARYFGVEINRITGRRNELVSKGFVIEHDKIKNSYNRMAIRWKIKHHE